MPLRLLSDRGPMVGPGHSLSPPSRHSKPRSLLLLVLVLHCSSSHALLPRLLPRRLEAVVLDADGSFLDPQHKVSPANAEAVLAARRAGLQVFLATGRARSGPWVEECLVPLSLDCPGVFTQGLTSFDALNQRVHEDKLAASAVAAVQRACESAEKGNGVTLAAYVQERLLVACGDECDPWLMRRQKASRCSDAARPRPRPHLARTPTRQVRELRRR